MYKYSAMFNAEYGPEAYRFLGIIDQLNPVISGIEEERELVDYRYGDVYRYIVWGIWESEHGSESAKSAFKEFERNKS